MTTFTTPVYVGGQATGNSTTDINGYVSVSKEIMVSAANKSATITLPANSTIHAVIDTVVSAVAGIAAGVTVRVGTAASSSLYGTASVSAEGNYSSTLTKQCVNNPTTVVIDATAQASAADWNAGKILVRVAYGSRA